jgi:hypothetical protein
MHTQCRCNFRQHTSIISYGQHPVACIHNIILTSRALTVQVVYGVLRMLVAAAKKKKKFLPGGQKKMKQVEAKLQHQLQGSSKRIASCSYTVRLVCIYAVTAKNNAAGVESNHCVRHTPKRAEVFLKHQLYSPQQSRCEISLFIRSRKQTVSQKSV